MDLNDQRKFTTHTDANLDEMLKMIMHEFVHACNDEVKMWVRKTLWFYEGLATNLAYQDYEITDLETCDFEKLEWNFNGYGSGSYSYAWVLLGGAFRSFPCDMFPETGYMFRFPHPSAFCNSPQLLRQCLHSPCVYFRFCALRNIWF